MVDITRLKKGGGRYWTGGDTIKTGGKGGFLKDGAGESLASNAKKKNLYC